MFDLIVLGGGPAGYLAAERGAEAGLNVCLIEKESLGGVCLNRGCIPSKTLLHSAKIYDYAKYGSKYGVSFADAKIDHEFVIKRKNKVVKKLVGGISAKLKKVNVTVVKGNGMIEQKTEDSNFCVSVNNERYEGKKLLIATGSSSFLPPIPGLKEGLESGVVATNREILDLVNVPKNMVIIGGGVIGMEMASYYNSIGVKVTIIEMLDHICGATDRECSEILKDEYMKKGVEFLLNAKVEKIDGHDVYYSLDGETKKMTVDIVLASIGRVPNVKGIGLENIGVYVDRGIVVDRKGRTNIAGVYAAGDVNGKSMLAHTAYRESEVCINNIIGKNDIMRYNAIPSVIYTNPEIASVGETEDTAKDKGYNTIVKKLPLQYSGRYLAENENGNGICKIVIDADNNCILGVSIIGNPSSEMIYAAALMIETQMQIEDIKELVFPHPTVCEIIRETLFE